MITGKGTDLPELEQGKDGAIQVKQQIFSGSLLHGRKRLTPHYGISLVPATTAAFLLSNLTNKNVEIMYGHFQNYHFDP